MEYVHEAKSHTALSACQLRSSHVGPTTPAVSRSEIRSPGTVARTSIPALDVAVHPAPFRGSVNAETSASSGEPHAGAHSASTARSVVRMASIIHLIIHTKFAQRC